MQTLNINNFTLAKVSTIRAACPQELKHTVHNMATGLPIIICKNTNGYGRVAKAGYIPDTVVVAGEAKKASLLGQGIVCTWAWIQNTSGIEIQADDAISCGELTEKLSSALQMHFYGQSGPALGQPWPSIMEVYPFENYMIFSMRGQKYRQAFDLEPTERKVRFNGGSVAVKEQFVDASVDTMPRVQTGVRYAYAPPPGNAQTMTRGALHSELFTQVIRNWSNILKAADAYVAAIKSGLYKPMQPSFYPIVIDDKGHLAGVLSANGIAIADFVRWSAAEQKKRGAFAYPAGKKLPLNTPGRIRNAPARVNQTKGIPQSAKPEILNKIRKAEKRIGVKVPGKPTAKQHSWSHRGSK